ncbi:MAG TPA: hypothetical protein VKJ47_18795, partial [Candidatus Binatia bacterium]|nr:hypothetical protein [Candidatus Binatia bacterium]
SVPWARAAEALPDYRKWSRVRFACPDYDFINKCSYFDYQTQRVHIRTSRTLSRVEKRRRSDAEKGRLRVSQKVELRARTCPVCGGPVDRKGCPVYRKVVYDLKISRFGAKRKVIECRASLHHCPACDLSFLPRKFKMLDRFGHGLKSWAMYLPARRPPDQLPEDRDSVGRPLRIEGRCAPHPLAQDDVGQLFLVVTYAN